MTDDQENNGTQSAYYTVCNNLEHNLGDCLRCSHQHPSTITPITAADAANAAPLDAEALRKLKGKAPKVDAVDPDEEEDDEDFEAVGRRGG